MPSMHLSDIDLNLLPTLLALLEERNVTRAAERLRRTQPAVSRSLSRLRVLLDDPILVRSGRSLTLSQRGEALLRPVRQLAAQAAHVLLPSTPFDAKTHAWTTRVATSDHVEHLLFPRLQPLVAADAPGLTMHVRSVDGVFALLRDDSADLLIGSLPDAPSDLRRAEIFDEPTMCLRRRSGPRKRRLDLDAFVAADHVFVAPRGQTRGPIDEALLAIGRERRIARVVPHFLVAPFLVASSDLITTLPESVARPFAELLSLELHEPPLALPRVRLSMVWHARLDADPAQRWFRDAVRRALRPDEGRAARKKRSR